MAKWSDVITLIKLDNPDDTNKNGFSHSIDDQSCSCFCNELSVGYSEFYKAQQAGYKEVKKVELHSMDYEFFYDNYSLKKIADYKGKRYKILRDYKSKNGEFIEIVLTDLSERGEANG